MEQVGLATLLSLAISQGVVAAFNPCGFAMLPAYLSYFLGLESDDETNPAHNILRGLVVGLTLTAGFLVFFGSIGLVASTIVSRSAIESRIAWATLVLGSAMVPLGISMLAGYEPKLMLPRLDKGGRTRDLPSVFLFGVSYAVVSLGCTAAIFFGTVVTSFTSRSVVDGTLVFLAYGAGMSLVIMVLTLGMSMARTEIATFMRRFLPYVNRVSGAFLVLAGVFLVIFGWWEIQTLRGNISTNPVVRESLEFQSTLQNWASDVGPTKIAVAAAFILAGFIIWAIRPILDPLHGRIVGWGFFALWALVEAVNYRFELFILPVARTGADVPERVGNWFTDPLRWPALFEVLAAVIVMAFASFRLRRTLGDGRHQPSPTPQGASRSSAQEPSTNR
jgi:cytochrome c biogenesis protein CcdA